MGRLHKVVRPIIVRICNTQGAAGAVATRAGVPNDTPANRHVYILMKLPPSMAFRQTFLPMTALAASFAFIPGAGVRVE